MAIHTTIKQITGMGVVDGDDNNDDDNDDDGNNNGGYDDNNHNNADKGVAQGCSILQGVT